jgi:hypothetical protein
MGYLLSNEKVPVGDKLGRMWEEVDVANFKALSRKLAIGIEENLSFSLSVFSFLDTLPTETGPASETEVRTF